MGYMEYSWKIVTSTDINNLRYTILNDFFDYVSHKAKSMREEKSYANYSMPVKTWYNVCIGDECYKLDANDYRDLCYDIAVELYQYNYGISINELIEEYDREKENIMHYLYLIFIGEIKRDSKEKEEVK